MIFISTGLSYWRIWKDLKGKILIASDPINQLNLKERIEFYEFSSNKFMDLSNLGLREIPKEIRSCHDVEYLILRSNEIHELPSWINELSSPCDGRSRQ